MDKIIFSTTVFPRKEIIANCKACGTEIKCILYEGYFDYQAKKRKLEKSIKECPKCKAVFIDSKVNIPWVKLVNGDYLARALNGDFLVWKDGKIYKWRYRQYGAETAQVYKAKTKGEAMRSCARHKEWKR